mgnify:CR=1 FL=1
MRLRQLANKLGIELLTEDDYRALQLLGDDLAAAPGQVEHAILRKAGGIGIGLAGIGGAGRFLLTRKR